MDFIIKTRGFYTKSAAFHAKMTIVFPAPGLFRGWRDTCGADKRCDFRLMLNFVSKMMNSVLKQRFSKIDFAGVKIGAQVSFYTEVKI